VLAVVISALCRGGEEKKRKRWRGGPLRSLFVCHPCIAASFEGNGGGLSFVVMEVLRMSVLCTLVYIFCAAGKPGQVGGKVVPMLRGEGERRDTRSRDQL
jgi:hypothetical protein